MEENIKTHLTSMLDVYKQSLKGVTQYIEESEKNMKESEEQISNAKQHKEEVMAKIAELSEYLGVTEEEESTDEPTEAQVG